MEKNVFLEELIDFINNLKLMNDNVIKIHMKNTFCFIFFVIGGYLSNLNAQGDYNISLVSVFSRGGSLEYNDIWGYVDEEGTEYAILGTQQGTSVISLANPASPQEVVFIPGVQSIWRDMKSYGHYVYCIADQGSDGLLVINMSGVSSGDITWSFYKPQITINSLTYPLNKCHNMYIDEKGILYLSGCTPIASGAVLMFDLAADPEEPPFLSNSDLIYSHDSYARGDTLYTSQINAGDLTLIDVSDKTMPVVLGSVETSLNFTHNAWLSDDGKYVFTTDEKPNGKVDAYNIEDVDNIILTDIFEPLDVKGEGVIPHNVHYHNGYLVVSWYTSGCVVVDASDPYNLIQVGAYNTWDGSPGGFNGAWGAYPFLPSGLILISDIQSGLVVLQPEYKRAARLEGIVTDIVTGNPVNNVKVRIFSNQRNEANTNFAGEYKTGIVDTGSFVVGFIHSDYENYGVVRQFLNGDTMVIHAELVPLGLNVEFSSFLAEKEQEVVALKWRTETEIDNEYFSVQRSVNGRDFIEIGRTPGGGTSVKAQDYKYLDHSPISGLNYYRIRSNSSSGESKITQVRQVRWSDENRSKIFPTFFTSELTVQTELSAYSIEVYSSLGVPVLKLNDLSGTHILKVGNLPTGNYAVKISDDFDSETYQVVKY